MPRKLFRSWPFRNARGFDWNVFRKEMKLGRSSSRVGKMEMADARARERERER